MSTGCIIAVGGFQHETNTFAPHKATFEGFDRADSWPALTRGEALFSVMEGLNIPISGFIEAARKNDHRFYPLLWCSAEPSSYVTSGAYERIVNEFCDLLKTADHLDAVYLDLHGAMVVEHFEDGEGEMLRRVREIIGDQIPVVVSLDLHANITEAMIEHASAITIFRTYPHLDMAATGARAYAVLEKILGGDNMIGSMRKIPFLFPLTSQCTDFEPCRSIYDSLEAVVAEN
jgi:microcystin degradation protein MlrC